MDLLTFSQILFFLMASLGILVTLTMGIIIGSEVIGVIKRVHVITKRIDHLSSQVDDKLQVAIETLLALPFWHYFSKKKTTKKESKK